ncbi:hypothetical protein [Paenibacillus sp. ALJ109b]|nr:hypothetical protein [Paenibacillus sp. ALJ109b]
MNSTYDDRLFGISLVLTGGESVDASGRLRMLHPCFHVTDRLRKVEPPTSAVLEQNRGGAMRTILNSEPKG